jgi:hypothetical protein
VTLVHEHVTRDYRNVRIRIAFHPGERRFAVSNPAIEKNPAWVPDVAAADRADRRNAVTGTFPNSLGTKTVNHVFVGPGTQSAGRYGAVASPFRFFRAQRR